MKHVMFGVNGYEGDVLVNLFNKDDSDNFPYVVNWKFLDDYGKKTLIVSIIDTFGEEYLHKCATIDSDGTYSVSIEIPERSDERWVVDVTYYESNVRAYIDVRSE